MLVILSFLCVNMGLEDLAGKSPGRGEESYSPLGGGNYRVKT